MGLRVKALLTQAVLRHACRAASGAEAGDDAGAGQVHNLISTECVDCCRSLVSKPPQEQPDQAKLSSPSSSIGFNDAVLAWRPAPLVPSDFFLALDAKFIRGALNVIAGPLGALPPSSGRCRARETDRLCNRRRSGKSSALLGLLGEMHVVSPAGRSGVSLPWGEGVAYKPQET